jgi:hypothetical protein
MAFFTEHYSGTGSSSGTPVDAEILTFVAGVATFSHVPITGSVHLYAGGGRDTPIDDYTVSGNQITISAALQIEYTQGAIFLADYRY